VEIFGREWKAMDEDIDNVLCVVLGMNRTVDMTVEVKMPASNLHSLSH
jgi:hypothetical protein